MIISMLCVFFFQAEAGIRVKLVTGVQTCALPISRLHPLEGGEAGRAGVGQPVGAGAPRPPRAVPRRLPRLRRLPEGEVERVALRLAHLDADARPKLVHVPPGELAVAGIAAHVEVDVAARGVGVTLVDEPAGQVDDLGDVPRRARIVGRRPEIQHLGIMEECFDVPLRDLLVRDPLLVRPGDDAVVDVGEVGDVGDDDPLRLEVSPDRVGGNGVPHVSDVRLVLDGHAADVHPRTSRGDGLEGDLRPAPHVVDANPGGGHALLLPGPGAPPLPCEGATGPPGWRTGAWIAIPSARKRATAPIRIARATVTRFSGRVCAWSIIVYWVTETSSMPSTRGRSRSSGFSSASSETSAR